MSRRTLNWLFLLTLVTTGVVVSAWWNPGQLEVSPGAQGAFAEQGARLLLQFTHPGTMVAFLLVSWLGFFLVSKQEEA